MHCRRISHLGRQVGQLGLQDIQHLEALLSVKVLWVGIIHAGNNSVDYSSTDWSCSSHKGQPVVLHSIHSDRTKHFEGTSTLASHNTGILLE